jgi:hypothetical protein
MLRANGEMESMQENIRRWLELDEEDPGFQFLTDEDNAEVIVIFLSSAYIIKFSTYLFSYFLIF